VAPRLGNTPAGCRRSYIHPALLERFVLGELALLPRPRARQRMELAEVALARFLMTLEASNTNDIC